MRKSTGEIFVIRFLKSFLFFIVFTAVIIGAYKLVMSLYGVEDDKAKDIIPSVNKQNPITEARIDDVSKHLIYCVDEDTGDIKKLVLEIYDCKKLMLYYVTIPIKTQLTLSEALHKELVLVMPSIPGYLKISAITGYLPKDTVYEYGVLMIEELLNIQISYYTVVPESIYDTVFETEDIRPQADSQQVRAYPREIFSEEFLEHLDAISNETELRNYIEELYSKIKSNLSFKDKLNYMESYINTPGRNIHFELIAGEDSNSSYAIDEFLSSKQLKAYTGE